MSNKFLNVLGKVAIGTGAVIGLGLVVEEAAKYKANKKLKKVEKKLDELNKLHYQQGFIDADSLHFYDKCEKETGEELSAKLKEKAEENKKEIFQRYKENVGDECPLNRESK